MNSTKTYWLCLLFLLSISLSAQNMTPPKREFRGAWIQIVNGQFQGLGTKATQEKLTRQLDAMQKCGENVVIFQIRGEGDAFYQSKYEPWSRFLTGVQGQPPSPYWDPLAWMIKECHKRGMELHAWINPYRAKTAGTERLAPGHPYALHPNRFFKYGKIVCFDPGLPENRAHICKVVMDIVRRYDVDGIHMDDYFYPYPIAGVPIPDDKTFAVYNSGYTDKADWRRYNVSCLIKELHDSINAVKPWVKFGISPFGIYHNQQQGSMVPGSTTRGLQDYDNLYADVLYWVNKGWIDYVAPQLYWRIGHPVADYAALIKWWDKETVNRPLVIGQDLERTAKTPDLNNPSQSQLIAKLNMQRSLPRVKGSCWWYSEAMARNVGNIIPILSLYYQRTPALLPEMRFKHERRPKKVRHLKALWMPDGYYLFWTPPRARKIMDKAYKYVIYRFSKGEKRNIERADKIVLITQNTLFKLPFTEGKEKYYYCVTALNRLGTESKYRRKKVKL